MARRQQLCNYYQPTPALTIATVKSAKNHSALGSRLQDEISYNIKFCNLPYSSDEEKTCTKAKGILIYNYVASIIISVIVQKTLQTVPAVERQVVTLTSSQQLLHVPNNKKEALTLCSC